MKLKPLDPVELIVLHCSATKPSMEIGIREIDLWHRQRGWLSCGYHMVIRRDGTLEFGRPLDRQGAHVKGHNHNSIGICMVGGIDDQGEPEDNFTDPQWVALKFALDLCKYRHPNSTVVGHYQLDQDKACPSFNVPDYLSNRRYRN